MKRPRRVDKACCRFSLVSLIPGSSKLPQNWKRNATSSLPLTILVSLLAWISGCQAIKDRQNVRPLVLRDVPAQRLSYRFEADTGAPSEVSSENSNEKLAAIQTDFSTRRPDDALLRTVPSPDGQRALALYGIESESSTAFRIDMYAADGKFLSNVIPPSLSCVFPETVAWSSDGNHITFIARKSLQPAPTPSLPGRQPALESEVPVPSPSVARAFPAIPVFATEQIYICNRDGFDLKPLTAREGLIYFYQAWAPDNHALVALACKEDEWNARERAFKLPAGRPRLIMLDGTERLLDDQLTECLPVWSPDSSKVATGFETDVGVFDAAINKPTQARIHLRDALIAASLIYQEKNSGGKKSDNEKKISEAEPEKVSVPPSFNPIMHVEWPSPDKLYLQTAFVRVYPNEAINTFQRWHRMTLSPQAATVR